MRCITEELLSALCAADHWNHCFWHHLRRYETSGVQGAILFLQTQAERFEHTFNIVGVPCVSPWGYETIQRECTMHT